MVKEIERAGIPVVHMCTVTPISMTVGANRIVPTIAIPHPLGNPALSLEEEKAIRRKLVERALERVEFVPAPSMTQVLQADFSCQRKKM